MSVTLTPVKPSKISKKLLKDIMSGKVPEIVVAIAHDSVGVRNICGEVAVKYPKNGNTFKQLNPSISSQPIEIGGEFRFSTFAFVVTKKK